MARHLALHLHAIAAAASGGGHHPGAAAVAAVAAFLAVCALALALCASHSAPGAGRLRRALASVRSEEHTSELQSRSTISYAVFCLEFRRVLFRSHGAPGE